MQWYRPQCRETATSLAEPFTRMWSNQVCLQEFANMSDLVFSVFAFHFIATIVWFAICGFGAIKVVTKRVRNRIQTAVLGPIVNAAS